MPDISKCSNEDCPLREKCYRFMAKPSYRQSYVLFHPECRGDECPHFWQLEENDLTIADIPW